MTPTIPQDEQSRLWNGSAGEAWSALQSPLDTLFRGIEHHLAQAVAQGADLQILDVGDGRFSRRAVFTGRDRVP